MLVQFGNNWIKKIPAKLAVLGIFLIQLFPNWTACSPITYTKRQNLKLICAKNVSYCERSICFPFKDGIFYFLEIRHDKHWLPW